METKGLPLDFILSILNKEEYRIDWLEFILTSVEHKWKLKGTMLKIENSMKDVYGKEFTISIMEILNQRVEKFYD